MCHVLEPNIKLLTTLCSVDWTQILEGPRNTNNEQIFDVGFEGEEKVWGEGMFTWQATSGKAHLGEELQGMVLSH